MHYILSAALVLAGLLLPGWGWARGARWPLPCFAAGVISVLAVFAGVMGLSIAGIGVSFLTMSIWLGLVAGAGFIYDRSRVLPPAPTVVPSSGRNWWLGLPAATGLAVAVWRAVLQPLSGPDVDFRWNYLAECLVQTGGLDFYPPFRAGDFTRYFWVDGIAPLVSSQYAWCYWATGDLDRHWTMIPVLLQLAGGIMVLHALGAVWGGVAGGWLACALAGATFLLQFAFNLGQETGFVTLGAAGMVYYLMRWEQGKHVGLLLPAACCAALAGCAREYGVVFALAGAGWIGSDHRRLRRALIFALLALALPMLWHLRNFYRTGNPLYPLEVAGLFPGNPVFAEWMNGYLRLYGASLQQAEGWSEIGRLFTISAMPALLSLLAGVVVFRGRPGWLGTLAVALLSALCWLSSVAYTAGGLFYAMRVLGPLLLIGCAWGGAVLATKVGGYRGRVVITAILGLWGVDAALRAWTLPANPYRLTPREWPRAGYDLQREFSEKEKPFLEVAAAQGTGKVLSDSAGAQQVFHAAGRELVPLWSPEVVFLFGPRDAGDAPGRLRALGYSHVLLKRSAISSDFLIRTGAAGRLKGSLKTVRTNDTYVLFALGSSRDEK